MTSLTIATLFSGGEGVGVGAMAAGLHHVWGIEDNDVAQVARDNGFNVKTADVTVVDPASFETVDVLHASPPCPNFSTAKQHRQETDHDIALANATVRFIEALQPRYFTLENVWLYRRSESWRVIADALNRLNYWYDLAHVNAADFGVPQTRRRMIVRACRGKMVPQLPPPEPWTGWYEAVVDLLPSLPESQFTSWQLRGVGTLRETALVDSHGHINKCGIRVPTVRQVNEPANTIMANHARRRIRAFIANGSNRVIQMTPLALARFQSFPDSYKLPPRIALASRMIGNAVPPLLYEKLIGQLVK